MDSYDHFEVGVGYFAEKVCEHQWCRPVASPAVVFVEAEGVTAYLCARHFDHMVNEIASNHIKGSAPPNLSARH